MRRSPRSSTELRRPAGRWSVDHATVVAYVALFMAMSGTAVAATGGGFILGQKNTADTVSTLTNTAGSALSLRSPSGVAPLQVNRSVRVDRLNADLLDGRDSTAFARLGATNEAARTTLSNAVGTPLRLSSASGVAPFEVTSAVKVRNLNADRLDGRDASEFVATEDLEALAAEHEALQGEHAALVTRVSALEELLSGVTRTSVDGLDTLRIAGVNLQLVNGLGSTASKNGLGNLIVGYNGTLGQPKRTGSHYVVVGDSHAWTAYGGVIAGTSHRANGAGASLLGGSGNTASGDHATVVGGNANTSSGGHATVSGGRANTADGDRTRPFWMGDWTSVSGGSNNTATGAAASILGGFGVTVTGDHQCQPAC
jgi:hypothetical protein